MPALNRINILYRYRTCKETCCADGYTQPHHGIAAVASELITVVGQLALRRVELASEETAK